MRIHLCECDGYCTADCSIRDACKKKRIPLLIHSVVIDYSEDQIYADEYLNEVAILKQKLVDAERKKLSEVAKHSFGVFNRDIANKLEIIEL